MLSFLHPQDSVDRPATDRGLRMLLYDGMFSQTMGVLTGGAFLVAFALLLGASNKFIGLLAAIGPLAQILQIPAIFLVDRTRARKAMVVISSGIGRLAWVGVALLPWIVPAEQRLGVLLLALGAFFALGAISGCAFNSWMRDLIPTDVMGSYFARRMALSIAIGAVLSIIAAIGVDLYRRYLPGEIGAYTILFSAGAAAGMIGLAFLARVPEPRMEPTSDKGLLAVLAEPFGNANFRKLLFFLASWNFAVAFAAPFFVVYMLRRIGLSMTWILSLGVVSMLMNVLFLRVWGRLADAFSNKSVLTVSGPLFMISIILWPFTTLPERYWLTIPLLIAIHALAGVSAAGVSLCSGNLALKSAPKGRATNYLAVNALVSGLAATAAPLLGGLAADALAPHKLDLTFRWTESAANVRQYELPAMSIGGLDFLFVASFLMGLYALHRLLAVREEGEVTEEIVRTEFYSEVRRTVRHVSNIPGLRYLTLFPYAYLKDTLGKTGPKDSEPGAEPTQQQPPRMPPMDASEDADDQA